MANPWGTADVAGAIGGVQQRSVRVIDCTLIQSTGTYDSQLLQPGALFHVPVFSDPTIVPQFLTGWDRWWMIPINMTSIIIIEAWFLSNGIRYSTALEMPDNSPSNSGPALGPGQYATPGASLLHFTISGAGTPNLMFYGERVGTL
jgi:hypothetical protein